jgi:chromosomal replication initiator protein
MAVDGSNDVKLERSADELWEAAQQVLRKKLKGPTFATWIEPLQLQKIEADVAVFAVNNDIARTQVMQCQQQIAAALSEVTGQNISLRVYIDANATPRGYSGTIASIAVVPSPGGNSSSGTAGGAAAPVVSRVNDAAIEYRNAKADLNPKYTFENLVVGSHNRFSASAAQAVAQRPGESYNPLFIHGGSGLGKTHIMQAIGHYVLQNQPKMLVRYITCERFTNDMINSLGNNSMIDFRKRYRQVDVLLVDDVHFIAGKESTQEEFFHTFNALRETGKQIVLTSDRPPKELNKLEERLRSRFEWGLLADIQAPDYETRMAILRKKASVDGIDLGDDVIEYMANSFTSNIRELEGALSRVKAYATLMGHSLNLSEMADVLGISTRAAQKNTISFEDIMGAVASFYRIDTSDIRGEKRSKDIALARQVVMYLAHDMLSMSHSRIGESIGGRAHSTVIHGIDKIKEEMPNNAKLSSSIQQIRRQLSG